jgi:alpha-ketoglutarate-dependent taurine dioxygenase
MMQMETMEPAAGAERGTLPLMVHADQGAAFLSWLDQHGVWIAEQLLRHGALLLRGFAGLSTDVFQQGAPALCGPLLEYVYRSTPRTAVGDNVYTATEYPATAHIPQHNENAFQRQWPMRLAFYCAQPSASGGETPLASTAAVTRRIRPDIVQRFKERGVMYIRNFGLGVDLSWQTCFQTTSEADVEEYCRRADIQWKWLPDGRLRTTQVCAATAVHPLTGEELWFNQAHVFHPSSLGAERYKTMLKVFGEDSLPRTACYGDGSPLEEDVLALVREVYESETVAFPWQRGDVLLLDNMQVSHGRRPYSGARQVLVAMGTTSGPAVSAPGASGTERCSTR